MLKPDRHRYSYYTSSFWLDATQQNTTGEAFSTTIDFRNASRTKKQNEQKHDERTQHKFTTTTFSNNSTTLINHPRPGCCRFLLFERSINGKNLSEFSLPRAFKSPSSYFEMHPPPPKVVGLWIGHLRRIYCNTQNESLQRHQINHAAGTGRNSTPASCSRGSEGVRGGGHKRRITSHEKIQDCPAFVHSVPGTGSLSRPFSAYISSAPAFLLSSPAKKLRRRSCTKPAARKAYSGSRSENHDNKWRGCGET